MQSHILAIETGKQDIGKEQESGYPSSTTQAEHGCPTKFLNSRLAYSMDISYQRYSFYYK
jgi:hypothetical protein